MPMVNGKFEFVVMGNHLLPLLNDLKCTGINYGFGEKKEVSKNFFFQVVSVAAKDKDKVEMILKKGKYDSIY